MDWSVQKGLPNIYISQVKLVQIALSMRSKQQYKKNFEHPAVAVQRVIVCISRYRWRALQFDLVPCLFCFSEQSNSRYLQFLHFRHYNPSIKPIATEFAPHMLSCWEAGQQDCVHRPLHHRALRPSFHPPRSSWSQRQIRGCVHRHR